MEFSLEHLQPKERASFALRSLYETAGCRKYHMGRFEEYSLYQENRSFLSSEQVITFTDLDGRLLALKPDVTLSIAKTAQPAPGETLRYYYHENVYRPSAESHTFKEISQMGLELLGAVGEAEVQQAVCLAAQSLAALGAEWVLEVSHMGYLFGLFDALGVPEAARAQLLETASNFIHQPPEKLAAALDSCIQTGKLAVRMFDGTPYIYLPDLLAAEQDIADRLAVLTKRGKQTAHGLDKNIQILELAQGFAYAPLQKEAIRKAMTENCLVLTGGPGTGKTTTVNAILQLLENEAERVALCAPTGRAAKRLSELTGRKASTIHRLLEVDYTGGVVSFIHNDKNLLKCDVVILDEMSMVDVKLFQALVTALRYSCRIIMVGDADQLPSVGPGNILGEIIRSGLVPTVCLNEIFRQAAQSLIVENAHHIISGEPLKKGGKTDDFFFLEADGDAAQKLVCDLVTTRLPRSYGFDPVRDIQVLCPTKLGPTGTQALNVELQNLLNPEQKGKPQLQSAARMFRVGDKVMQVRNNYEIVWNRIGGEQGVGAYNGDIGIVESINLRERSMVVRMDDRRLLYPAENLNELEIAYAITVHKSQGSEFPAVILPVAQVPPRLCYRNLFYTGVTRARKLCVVAGRRDVVNSMMSNIRQNLRYSGLCALLQAGQPPQQLSTEGESP